MISCPNCGWSNNEANRYCENCGADLRRLSGESPAEPPPPAREPWTGAPRDFSGWGSPPSAEEQPTSADWKMAPLPFEPPPEPGRRIWLWVVIGLLVACLVVCGASLGWLQYTDSGRNFQTRVAEEATQQAGQP